MMPIILLQNTPVADIKYFCEHENYSLVITSTGKLILIHEVKEK